MSIRAESPIPVFAALGGLWLGAAVGAFALDALIGDSRGVFGAEAVLAATAGAVVGAVGGGAAALWAVRRGSVARTLAAAAVGAVLAAGAGAWTATEVWQRGHTRRTLIHPAPICLRGETERQCLGRERRTRPPAVVVSDSEEVDRAAAVTGAVAAGALGAIGAAVISVREGWRPERA